VAIDICKQSDPTLMKVSDSHKAACLLLVK